MDGLLKLGIGPFQVFNFTPKTVVERRFRGASGSFELTVCFAKQGALTFEIMQPTSGESLMAEYLEQVRRFIRFSSTAYICSSPFNAHIQETFCGREANATFSLSLKKRGAEKEACST